MHRCAAVWLSVVVLAACSGPFPVEPGYSLTVQPNAEPIDPDKPRYATTLQLRWLDTGFYYIQLGDGAVVTDPFLSHHGALYSVFGGTLTSDAERVQKIEPGPIEPLGALIGHAHWDHMLDLDAIFDYRNWDDTVIVGSDTVRNILAYDEGLYNRWQHPEPGSNWRQLPGNKTTQIHYRAYSAEHAPQIDGILLYPGKVDEPQRTPPTKASDFQIGDSYSFLIRLRHGESEFTVFVMTSASPWPAGFPTGDLPPVDVAILCVPSFEKAKGYPEKFVEELNARHIVLSHYNDFFDDDYANPRTNPGADVQEFLRRVQDAARGTPIEKIHVPDVGALMLIDRAVDHHD